MTENEIKSTPDKDMGSSACENECDVVDVAMEILSTHLDAFLVMAK